MGLEPEEASLPRDWDEVDEVRSGMLAVGVVGSPAESLRLARMRCIRDSSAASRSSRAGVTVVWDLEREGLGRDGLLDLDGSMGSKGGGGTGRAVGAGSGEGPIAASVSSCVRLGGHVEPCRYDWAAVSSMLSCERWSRVGSSGWRRCKVRAW